MAKRRKQRNQQQIERFELNLIPVMNLFVCLVPFLLLTAAFVRLGGIDTETPTSSAEEQNQVEREPYINLYFELEKDMLKIGAFKDGFQERLPEIEYELPIEQLEKLHPTLEHIAEEHPKIESSLFRASHESVYETVIQVLNKIKAHESTQKTILAAEVAQ